MIHDFNGRYRFLSNFAYSPITYAGQVWPGNEWLYQALKTDDLDQRENIRRCETPGQAKRLGQTVAIRPRWDNLKDSAMSLCLDLKFEPKSVLAIMLMETDPHELVEGNNWGDTYWGACPNASSRGNPQWVTDDGQHLYGRNRLGQLLMSKRLRLLHPHLPTADNA